MTKQELDETIRNLRAEQMRMEADSFQSIIKPSIENSIGRTFVYRNNNRGGEKKWDVFGRIIGYFFTPYHAYIFMETCQVDGDGAARLETESKLISQSSDTALPLIMDGWRECKLEEFEREKRRTLAALVSPELLVEAMRAHTAPA